MSTDSYDLWLNSAKPFVTGVTRKGFYIQVGNDVKGTNPFFYKVTCNENSWKKYLQIKIYEMPSPRTVFKTWIKTYTKYERIEYNYDLIRTLKATPASKYGWLSFELLKNFAEMYSKKTDGTETESDDDEFESKVSFRTYSVSKESTDSGGGAGAGAGAGSDAESEDEDVDEELIEQIAMRVYNEYGAAPSTTKSNYIMELVKIKKLSLSAKRKFEQQCGTVKRRRQGK